jgi:hypothetical protein
MKDDFQIPNLGQAPDNYDIGFFNRFARNIEMTLMTLRGKGRGIFSDVQTDQIEVVNGGTFGGDVAIGGAATVGSNLAVAGTSNLHNTNVTGAMAATGAVQGATVTGTTSMTTPLMNATTSVTTPLNITPAVKFPATQVLSSDPNTLDDYEEGTWTPTVTSQAGTITSYTASGTYMKVGRTIFYNVDILFTNIGSASGFILCTLPTNWVAPITCGSGRENAVVGFQLQAVNITTNQIVILTYNNGFPGGTNYHLYVSGFYFT